MGQPGLKEETVFQSVTDPGKQKLSENREVTGLESLIELETHSPGKK